MNRDLLIIKVESDIRNEEAKLLYLKFKEEYVSYFIIMLRNLDYTGIELEVTKLDR